MILNFSDLNAHYDTLNHESFSSRSDGFLLVTNVGDEMRFLHCWDVIIISVAVTDYSRVTFAARFGNGGDPNPKIKILIHEH